MRRLAVAGGMLSVGMLAVMCISMAGCCFSPQPIREEAMVTPPPAPRPVVAAPEPLPPPPAPAPRPYVPPPAPAPIAAPAPYMPAPVAKAIQDLSDTHPGLFTLDREKGLIRFNSDIMFDSGSSTVKADARAVLLKLAGILASDSVRDRAMTVVGFTDTDRVAKAATIAHLKALGKGPDNQGLSEARAESVGSILKEGGVTSARMTTRGKGPADPVAENTTAAGKAKNRRVEIYLTPAPGAGRAAAPAARNFASGE